MYVQNQEETMFFSSDSEVGGFFWGTFLLGSFPTSYSCSHGGKFQHGSLSFVGGAWKDINEGHSMIRSWEEHPSQELSLFCWLLSSPSRHGGAAAPGFPLFLSWIWEDFCGGKKEITFFLESLCLKSNFFLSLLFRNQRESCLTIQSWQEYLACFNIFLKAPREALLSFAQARPSVATNS